MRKTVAKKSNFSYEVRRVSINANKTRWLCIEKPTGSIIVESEFKGPAQRVCDHQNEHKEWAAQGGIPFFLTLGVI
tara:strand:- start:450 stop:677 length:228 start_codon:yes stop_codon:yes gene_type:complete